jgi:hypothetical protein
MKDYIPLLQTAVWAGLALLILVRFGPEVKQRMRAGGLVEIGPVKLGEIQAKVDRVENQVNDLNEKVAQLFLATMSDAMYGNLKKIASGHFGDYKMGGALERELRFLRDFGYIKAEYISQIPKEGPDLSKYASATDTGKRFVALSEEHGRGQISQIPSTGGTPG